jgi:LAO/AO transport system kinase
MLLLDAAGRDILFVETVGTGQSEIEIAQVADTVVLVLMPGSGDAVQALKAGIMEIPDVIAVNKRDHPQTRAAVREIKAVLALAGSRDWQPPVVTTEAVRGEGIDELWRGIEDHRAYLGAEGRLEQRRRRSLSAEVFALASGRAKSHLEEAVAEDAELRRLLDAVERRELDPLSAVAEILDRVFRIDADGRPGDR